ncbi:MAG: ATPase, T2SS/T4P/T4SS family [Pseudomonadota bacterium]
MKKLGDILLEMGLIEKSQLESALAETTRTGAMLGDVLLKMGFVSEEKMQLALSVLSGTNILDISNVVIDYTLIEKIPESFAITHSIFPFAQDGQIIKIATSNPFDVIVRDNLERITGNKVEFYIAPNDWVTNAIKKHYKTASKVDEEIAGITAIGSANKQLDENSTIKLADLLIEKGRMLNASDIHVIPETNIFKVSYRSDNEISQEYTFPKYFQQGLITRFKIMGNISIDKSDIPLEGCIKFSGKGSSINVCISASPAQTADKAMAKKRIGDILLEMGFVGNDQLDMALMEAKRTGVMLGSVLVRLDWISEEQMQMALAVQSGAKIVDISSVKIDFDLIASIPEKFVTTHNIFPFAKDGQIIKIATSNPFDVIVNDNLGRITNCRVESYIAPKEWIRNSIELYYKVAAIIDEEIDNIIRSSITDAGFDENQTIRLADLIIEKGRVLNASDIHVVADTNLVRIYYRVDGVLHQKYLFPKQFQQSLVTRFKIMGDMDISNPNIPLDGRFKFSGKGEDINIRISTFPTHLGETVVMRLLIYSGIVGNLERLGFEKEERERFTKGIHRPYGLILVTGPTGSGKTTTLYSALMTINSPHINVMTVEDPIEYVIPTLRQTAVNPKAGLTFASAIRSAMRQDPDVILVGEIRDQETAELAIRASITGHLVLSTLHTNDAASAINRLVDLGVNPNMLASSLSMIAAQRLLRKLCQQCAAATITKKEDKEIFIKNGLEPPAEMLKAVGCDACNNSGYSGRIAVYEIIMINREIIELIFSGATQSAIEDAAVKSGTSLLFKQALRKIHYRITSLEEVLRVVAYA